jgi:hypothetical protein
MRFFIQNNTKIKIKMRRKGNFGGAFVMSNNETTRCCIAAAAKNINI